MKKDDAKVGAQVWVEITTRYYAGNVEVGSSHWRTAGKVKAIATATEALADLRAEIARLKPAAEAWEAEETFRREVAKWTVEREHGAGWPAPSRKEFDAAAARARAAKERKP